MPTVLVGADLCPIEGNRPFFISGDAESLFHDLLPEIQAADLAIANLEGPLVDSPSPIPKTGPIFGEPSACITGIRNAGFHALGLANNHILDHGAAGLQNTLRVCAEAGIATVGAGPNLAEASRLLIREADGIRIGVLAVAEHEFSIATRDSWGANPYQPESFVRTLHAHRNAVDFLLVLFHGGDEFHVPSPRIKDTCHFMIELGAHAVVVQHPHLLGGIEEYQGGHIIYGQGALVMDEAIYRNRASFHEGFLARFTLRRNQRHTLEILPFSQSTPVPGARRLSGEAEARFREALDRRSKAILDDAFVEREWLEFCKRHRHGYLSGLLGHHRILRKLNWRGWLFPFLYPRRVMLGVRNTVVCETHREVIQTLFDRRLL